MMARCKLNPCCGATMPGKCKPPPQFKPRESYRDYERRTNSTSSPVGDDGIVQEAREAIRLALEWDERRNYIMPYRVRDALRASLAAEREGRSNV